MCSLTILKLKISLKPHLFFRRIVLPIHYIYCVLNVSAQVDKSWIVRRMLTDLYLFYLNLTHNTRIVVLSYYNIFVYKIKYYIYFKPINIQYITLEIIFFIYYCIIVLYTLLFDLNFDVLARIIMSFAVQQLYTVEYCNTPMFR